MTSISELRRVVHGPPIIQQSHFGSSEITALPPSTLPTWRLRLMARRIERKALRIRRSWRRQGHGNMEWRTAFTFAIWELCGTPIDKIERGTYRVSGLNTAKRPSDWATAYSIANP